MIRLLVFILLLSTHLLSNDKERIEAGMVAYISHDYNRSFSLLSPLESSHTPGIDYLLGKMYMDGHGTACNTTKAIALLTAAAKGNHTSAMTALIEYYSQKDADRHALLLALHWYMQLPDEEKNVYRLQSADILRRLGRYREAFDTYKTLSKRYTVPEPTYIIAQMFEQAQGRPANLAAARSLYRAAAKKGYAPAQYRLGLMLANDCRSRSEKNDAIRWLQQADRQRIEEAKMLLQAIEAGKICRLPSD